VIGAGFSFIKVLDDYDDGGGGGGDCDSNGGGDNVFYCHIIYGEASLQ
jgi:hypothetical protein